MSEGFCYNRPMKYYLAGGAVRNLLLGSEPEDFDFVFSGNDKDFISLNPDARKLGHGPAWLLFGHEFSPLAGEDVGVDLRKRDFTVNSFLLEENGILHMHPRALADLENRVLEPSSDESLLLDPLRVFRAARFCAVFPEFSPSEKCLRLMAQAALDPGFKKIAPERVGRETLKTLQGSKPGNFLRVLEKGNSLCHWFKELAKASAIPAGPVEYHKTDVLEHIAEVMDDTARETERWQTQNPELSGKSLEELRLLAVWMALCHDLGKVDTPGEILPHHYQHETRGMRSASSLACRLRLPERLRQAGILAAKLHMKAGIYTRLRPATRVDLLMEAGARNLLRPLFLLAQADADNPDLLELAERELALLKEVRLETAWENKGKASGKRLRDKRCQALAEAGIVISAE